MALFTFKVTRLITPDRFERDAYRMNWYYDRYQFKIEFDLPYIQYFRNARTVDQYERQLDRLGDLNMISLHHLVYRSISDSNPKVFDAYAAAAVIKFVRWRSENEDQNQSKTYFIKSLDDKIAVYTGDLGVIQSLIDLYTEEELQARQVRYLYSTKMPGFDKTVLYRVDPKNKFRIYLKSRSYSRTERLELYEFLNSKNVKFTWTMQNWLLDEPTSSWNSTYRTWAFSSQYFDFDDDTLITMLYLKFNGIIGKVCSIQKKINT
jgi:hypothetical protein